MRSIPLIAPLWRRLYRAWVGRLPLEEVFRRKYYSPEHAWSRDGASQSLSGKGSDISETATIRTVLPGLVRRLGVSRMLDLGCGDFHWMREVDLGETHYVGIDIVPGVVEANRQRYASDRVSFEVLDATKTPLPPSDLILCRDVLVHLPLSLVDAIVRNCRASGARYLLATNFATTARNEDIPAGFWHAVNLRLPPFALGEPLELVIERHSFSSREDKELCLWDLRGSETGRAP